MEVAMKAVWNSITIAQSDDIVMVEGNAYFPADALDPACIRPSATRTTCPWKGVAHYYTLVAAGREDRDACWYYPEPKPAADAVRGRVAFARSVSVS
jgi:uncharacterized protein (DUF427 family)